MNELIENNAFTTGIVVGLLLYQQKVVAAHKRKEPLKIGDDLYYVQSGEERFTELIDEICR